MADNKNNPENSNPNTEYLKRRGTPLSEHPNFNGEDGNMVWTGDHPKGVPDPAPTPGNPAVANRPDPYRNQRTLNKLGKKKGKKK